MSDQPQPGQPQSGQPESGQPESGQLESGGARKGPNRAFGYDLDGNVIEHEAALIRESAHRVAYEGSTFSAEARWLQERGAWTPAEQWFPARVSRILLAPRVVGDRPAKRGGTPQAILDRETYEAIVAAADARHRSKAGKPEFKATSLLGGIAHCARCGAAFKLTGAAGKRSYRCPANRRLGEGRVACGRTQIVEAGLDAFVSDIALAWWAHDSGPARAHGVPELRAVREELAIVTRSLAALAEQYAISLIDPESYRVQRRKLTSRQEVLTPWAQRLEATGLPGAEGEEIYSWWEGAGLEARHALVGAVFPELLVGPSRRPGPGRGSDQIDTSRVTTPDGELLRFPPGHDEDD